MRYYELSQDVRAVYGVCAVVLMMAAVFLLVTTCIWYRKGGYVAVATCLAAAVLFVLQGICDVNYCIERGESFSFFADKIGKLPCGVLMFLLLLAGGLEILLGVQLLKRRSNHMSPDAVKEGLDALPDGVCFFDEDGQPLLVNSRMNRICGELFDTEILNAEEFWQRLQNKEIEPKDAVIRTEPTVLVKTQEGKVWDIHRNLLMIENCRIHELVAYDVTTQYQLNEQLDRKNQQLSQINERLRQYSREVERVITEQEILNAKRQVHDNVGRSLLAFRAYLAQSPKERNRDKLLLLWQYTIHVLKNEPAPPQQVDSWDILQKAAKAVDVAIVFHGEMPKQDDNKEIILAALHECLTNTVKHAGGNEMYVDVKQAENEIVAQIRNNGKLPNDNIQETGGLKNLRHMVERAGGNMRIECIPRFVLEVTIPKGEAELCQK